METTTMERSIRDGDDCICPSCGCEVTVKHTGDLAGRGSPGEMFTCWCGTVMEFERADETRRPNSAVV